MDVFSYCAILAQSFDQTVTFTNEEMGRRGRRGKGSETGERRVRDEGSVKKRQKGKAGERDDEGK